ncbi:MAG: hypothetical protein ACTSVC_00070 [Promethearchaeota archaeon]
MNKLKKIKYLNAESVYETISLKENCEIIEEKKKLPVAGDRQYQVF